MSASAYLIFAFGLTLVAAAALLPERQTLRSRITATVAYRVGRPSLRSDLSAWLRRIAMALFNRTKSADLQELNDLSEVMLLIERLLAAGDSPAGAIEWISARADLAHGRGSVVLTGLNRVATRIGSGGSLVQELKAWQVSASSRELQEFLAKLIASTTQGSDVISVLRGLRRSVDSAIRAKQLSNFSGTETRMLVPLVFLVLPITVLFAVFPSMTLLNLDFSL
jgi:tight adherence protein C